MEIATAVAVAVAMITVLEDLRRYLQGKWNDSDGKCRDSRGEEGR